MPNLQHKINTAHCAPHLVCYSTSRFFSPPPAPSAPSPIMPLIDRIFNEFEKNMRHTLIQVILTNQCMRAEEYHRKDSRLAQIIAEIPASWDLKRKLAHLKHLLEAFHASPVLTGHPTRVLSNEVIYITDRIVATAMAWTQHRQRSSEALALEQHIKADIESLLQQSMLPHENLTPQKEAEFANYIYKNILDAYPEFLNRVVHQFIKVHGGDKHDIKQELQVSVMRSFQNVWSWVIADLDGNPNKTAETMEGMIPALQRTIIDLYLKRLEPLRAASPKLQSAYLYLERCKEGMARNICFNVMTGNEAKDRFLTVLDQEIACNRFSSPRLEQLTSLRDLVNMAGFWGGLKEFVRQSSKVNSAVFENFIQILNDHHANILTFMKTSDGTIRTYHQLDSIEKAHFHNLLKKDSAYFETLKKQGSRFTLETNRELDRLDWVLKHQDIFTSYITSDTTDIITLDEVVLLFRFSLYRRGLLHIGEIRKSPVNLLPLCETPNDLTHLVSIMTAMLDDPYLRALIIKRGTLSFVAGPSDLGKVGGVFTLVQLIWAGKQVEDLLTHYKTKHPELAPVVLSILYGLGGDSKRRVSEAKRQLHSTFQGSDAHSLATHGAYVSYLENVVGRPSENTLRAQELRLLEQDYPNYFNQLQHLMQQAINSYQVFAEQACTKELLKKLTVQDLGPRMNTSSRSEVKELKPQDITRSRAIGLVNYQLMTGVLWDTFMGAESLIKLEPSVRALLPFLFEKSTVIQEIVYKVIYAIAVSDIPRAWKKISPDVMPTTTQIRQWAYEYANPDLSIKQHHHALAHIDVSAQLILKTMISFFPLAHLAHVHFNDEGVSSKPSHQVALECLDAIGCVDKKANALAKEIRFDLLPRYKRLAACIDAYLAHPTPTHAENAILACRGDERLTAGPTEISNMSSWLMTTAPAPEAQDQESVAFAPSLLRAKL